MKTYKKFLVLLSLGASLFSVTSVSYSKSILEDFDNDSGILENEGIVLLDNTITVIPNVLSQDANMIGYWRCNEISGTTMSDETTNQYDGLLQNMDNKAWSSGVYGNALKFNGINEYVSISDNNDLDGFSEFTLECWVKPYPQTYIDIAEPVVHYWMDDQESTGSVIDEVNSYNALCSNGRETRTISVNGRINSAFDFDTTYCLTLTNNIEINTLSDGVSISFWLNAETLYSTQHIISEGNSGAFFDITLEEHDNNNNLMKVILSDNDTEIHPGYLIPTDSWHHIAVVLNGRNVSSLKVYVDGEEVSPIVDSRLLFYVDFTKGSLNAEYSKGQGQAIYSALRYTTNPATYCDENGVIKKVTTVDTPRFTHGYYDETGFHQECGLLIEKHAFNYALYSEDLSNTAWTKTDVTVYTNQISAPDGTLSADKVVAEADNGTILQYISDDNDTNSRCFSIFIKGSPTTDTAQITIDGGTTWENVTLSSTGWRRFQCYNQTPNRTIGVRLPNDGDAVYVWGSQLEDWRHFATSYIPTTSATGYRSWDHVKYEIAGNRNETEETIHMECVPEYYVTGAYQLTSPQYLGYTDGDVRRIFLGSQNGKHFCFSPNLTYSSTCSAESYQQQVVKHYLYKITVTCQNQTQNAPYAEAFVNGSFLDNDGDSYTSPLWGTYFHVGIGSDQNSMFNGIIKNCVIFDERLLSTDITYINNNGLGNFIGYADVSNLGSIANNNDIKIGEDLNAQIDDFRIYGYALTSKQVRAIHNEASGINSSEPVVYYTFNDNDTSPEVTDAINAYNAICSDVVTQDISVSGKVNTAFGFDGTFSLELENNGAINTLSDELSISFWINAATISGADQHIISKDNDGAFFDITLEEYDSSHNLMRVTLSDNDTQVKPGYLIPVDSWHHASIVLNGREESSLKLYLDGEEITPNIDPRLLFYVDFTKGQLEAEYGDSSKTAVYTAQRYSAFPATYCDANGVIQKITTPNTPRFTHGYYDETGFHKEYGLLIEKYAHNYAFFSENFADAIWVKTNVSVTSDQTTAPDGTNTADKLEASLENGTVLQSVSDNDGKSRCFSIFIKGSPTTDTAQITIDGGSTWENVTLSSTGWRRFQCHNTIKNRTVGIRLLNEGDIIYVWGAQLEANLHFATSYIPTTGSNGYRDYDLLKYKISGNRNASEETIHMECVPEYYVNAAYQLVNPQYLIYSDTYARRIFLGSQNGKHFVFSPNLTQSSTCYAESYQVEIVKNFHYKVTTTCQDQTPYAEGYVNGFSVNTDSQHVFVAPSWDSEDYFYIGRGSDQNSMFNGIMKNCVIFDKSLSDPEVKDINKNGIESFIGYADVHDLGSIANNSNITIGEGLIAKLDDFRIYDYALKQNEIKTLYNDNDGTEISEFIKYGIVSKYDNDGEASYAMLSNTSPQFYTTGNTIQHLFPSIQPNEWYHTAITYDNESANIYINGGLVASRSSAGEIKDSSASLLIGAWGDEKFFKGEIDEIILRDTALSGDEIAEDSRYYVPEAYFKGLLCNLGSYVENYDKITVISSDIIATQKAYISFSPDGTNFYDNDGNATNQNNSGVELDNDSDEIDISSLGWGDTNLYYKIIIFNTTVGITDDRIAIDSISVEFTEKDSDNDGLSDYDEDYVYLTNPNSVDSDNDGLNDGDEVYIYFTNPALSDTDGDTLSDYDEINTYQTNPRSADSDGDDLSDDLELQTPYYNPHVVNIPIEYTNTQSTPTIDIVCYDLSRDCLLIKGTSSNERPIKFHFGDTSNPNSTFINTSDEFSYSLRKIDCSISNNQLQVTFVPIDGGAAFSPNTGTYSIIVDTESAILTPPDGAKISIKGVE